MKRGNEFAVGLAVLTAVALVIGGALWLSETDVNQKQTSYTARFRTVGGLGVGAPVTLRGVRVGRVEAIRLIADDWVETDLTIDRSIELPAKPAVISASASLFGEWSANIVSFEPLPDDPNVRAALMESDRAGGESWPGATLPDVGELTAQASRIAGDVAEVTQSIQNVFDSTALRDLRQSVLDLAATANRLAAFAERQTGRVERVGENIVSTSNAVTGSAESFQRTMERFDSATQDNRLRDIMENSRASTADLREASADLRQLMAAIRSNEASLVRVLAATDTLLTGIQSGDGTLGMLATDSALYRETTLTMRQFRALLTDIQANPRRYIKISVF